MQKTKQLKKNNWLLKKTKQNKRTTGIKENKFLGNLISIMLTISSDFTKNNMFIQEFFYNHDGFNFCSRIILINELL